mgnify:CR=1 FL=1|jgi:hypothetical protein
MARLPRRRRKREEEEEELYEDEEEDEPLLGQIATLNTELLDRERRIIDLEGRTKTSLSGMQFITIVLIGPLFLAFVTLGILIVWKTTSNPTVVAPHLDVILLAFAIFANPVTAAASAIMSLMSDEIKSRIARDDEEAERKSNE